ncbi:DEAD/DEAH box helicase [Arcanobacterium ihumii]|uniref:DEAD/DEAH box helicase n=1 Tax=Arcanobacterium ihumii TaxID=2138162 RepID=UPI001F2990C1|nr:SNF2-related protein [Arcanobacterium ihumii]
MGNEASTISLNDYQAKYFAHQLERSYSNEHVGKLAGLLFDAQVEPKPHQIDAALFALQTPYMKGIILADEVGLGKTIEAGIVISQFWAERKRQILIIAPASLRQQWKQELWEKFMLPAELIDRKTKDKLRKHDPSADPTVFIVSYEFAKSNQEALLRHWDIIVADEAHRLRNYWSGNAKTASAISQVFRQASKVVLLTATPLQNRLEELYGLVSTFDTEFFHSLDAFRERYIKNRSLVGGDDLAERVRTIAKRTLRRDAEKYIRFTQRIPITVEFEPSNDEKRLYELVDSYLQRDDLYAFASSQRFLSATIIRKRLGSSTYAVAHTLENIANRLQSELDAGQLRNRRGNLFEDEQFDLTSDELEELENINAQQNPFSDRNVQEEIEAEINELHSYAALARSITVNQKAVHVRDALEQGFAKLREIGAPEKAIIFTDSTVTQAYLERHLTEIGYGDGLVLFNGTNNSPRANQIYRDWLEENADTDLITGNPSADRRKALVDYFRDHGKIMIATEAASEGVNLQFASMLINYDLPWNPQRVEQRIGRIHRFGQKFNVVIANFLNKGNVAEQRILELLTEKFQLFSSVFGASDEILGSIEDGLDMERKVAAILAEFKTAEEISAAFDQLEAQYASEIDAEMKKAKTKVFDHLDPHVQDRLKNYDKQSDQVLNQFERLLMSLTRYELADYATFDSDTHNFSLNRAPVEGVKVGKYFFKSSPLPQAHQYRYASPLARYVIDAALQSHTPEAEIEFSISKSPRATKSVRELAGQSGILTVRKLTFSIFAQGQDLSESYLISAGRTTHGKKLDSEYVDDILNLTAVQTVAISNVDIASLSKALEKQAESLYKEVKHRNSRYYSEQEDVTYRNLQDRKAEHEKLMRELEAKIKQLRKDAKNTDDALESLKLKRKADRLEDQIDDAEDSFREQKRQLRKESRNYLDSVEDSLKGTETQEELFTIRWRIVK